MFNHCRVSERVHVRVVVLVREWDCICVCVSVRVCVCVCVRHGTRLRCKKRSNEPAPLFGNFFVSSVCICDHSVWSTLIFYYLLLSDYWPSCYLLYKELTLISSSPPLSELKGQFTCNSSNPQSGFHWISLCFLTFTLLWRKTLCPCIKTVSVSLF